MQRRDLLSITAATSVAHVLSSAFGCAAQSGAAPRTLPPPLPSAPAAPDEARLALQRAAADCVRAGELCLAHCIRSLVTGSTMMADCVQKVRVMLAICRAVEALASTDSAHLPALARICIAACSECEAACMAHAQHHAECAECARACHQSVAAARAVAA